MKMMEEDKLSFRHSKKLFEWRANLFQVENRCEVKLEA